MTTSYSIWKSDTPLGFEVVVTCDTCYKRISDCDCPEECEGCEECDNDFYFTPDYDGEKTWRQ